jgi:hypothetical protein
LPLLLIRVDTKFEKYPAKTEFIGISVVSTNLNRRSRSKYRLCNFFCYCSGSGSTFSNELLSLVYSYYSSNLSSGFVSGSVVSYGVASSVTSCFYSSSVTTCTSVDGISTGASTASSAGVSVLTSSLVSSYSGSVYGSDTGCLSVSGD